MMMVIAQCLIEYNHYCNNNNHLYEVYMYIYSSIMANNKHLHINALEVSVCVSRGLALSPKYDNCDTSEREEE